MLPEMFGAPGIRLARRVVGGVLLLLALVVAFRALTG
jgi:hypothetical protein